MRAYVLIALMLALLMALVGLAFALQNTEATTVSFLVWEFESSLAVILLGAVAIGALVSFFALMPLQVAARVTSARSQRRLAELEGRLAECERLLEQAGQEPEASTAPSAEADQPSPPPGQAD